MGELFMGAEIVFMLTTSLSLFAQVVFVFGFVKLTEPNVKKIFRMFFFANLLFSLSQVTILIATLLQGFQFGFFILINALFSFLLAIFLLVTIREAETFSKKVIAEAGKNGS